MDYKVLKVIDGETFKVYPHWSYNGHRGDTVCVAGIETPPFGEDGHLETTEILRQIIEDRHVRLTNPVSIHFDRLVCDVNLNGHKLFS